VPVLFPNPDLGPGFLLRILWCSQSGDHPENSLAKFGYILDMKVKKENRILLSSSWLPTKTCHKYMGIWNLSSSKYWGHFSMKNHLYSSK
jgi:hypothetical protein